MFQIYGSLNCNGVFFTNPWKLSLAHFIAFCTNKILPILICNVEKHCWAIKQDSLTRNGKSILLQSFENGFFFPQWQGTFWSGWFWHKIPSGKNDVFCAEKYGMTHCKCGTHSALCQIFSVKKCGAKNAALKIWHFCLVSSYFLALKIPPTVETPIF